jgi:hypothetical protein
MMTATQVAWENGYLRGANDAQAGRPYNHLDPSEAYYYGYGDYENGYYDPNW